MVFLEPSLIDKDFEENFWVPSVQELQHILEALDESDKLTYELLGHGWNGRRSYWKLHDFM